MKDYSVKQLAELAGVSRRTLHYYDQIGLLKPERQAGNRYRRYGEEAVYRLQQILFYRELGLSLAEIQTVLSDPGFDLVRALERHRQALQERRSRLDRLLQTVELTIISLKGGISMEDQQLFEGFDDEQEKQYAQEAVQKWGNEAAVSIRLWNSYGPEKQKAIREEGNQIYLDFTRLIGEDPLSEPVQAVTRRWHQHMRYFYEPDIERLLGLAEMYVESPDFRETFDRFDPRLAPFMRLAILSYCKHLQLP